MKTALLELKRKKKVKDIFNKKLLTEYKVSKKL